MRRLQALAGIDGGDCNFAQADSRPRRANQKFGFVHESAAAKPQFRYLRERVAAVSALGVRKFYARFVGEPEVGKFVHKPALGRNVGGGEIADSDYDALGISAGGGNELREARGRVLPVGVDCYRVGKSARGCLGESRLQSLRLAAVCVGAQHARAAVGRGDGNVRAVVDDNHVDPLGQRTDYPRERLGVVVARNQRAKFGHIRAVFALLLKRISHMLNFANIFYKHQLIANTNGNRPQKARTQKRNFGAT